MSTQYLRFSARTAAPQRSSLLERLLAGADGAAAVVDWRNDAFRLIAPQSQCMPSLGAAALYASCGAVAAAWAFLATPVHYIVEISNVRMAPHGILSLGLADAELLARDFNRVWHDAGLCLKAGTRGELFCLADRPMPAATRDPENALDRHIENFLPSGADSAGPRRLMSEIEMWLFDHTVNRNRIAAGAPAVNGLWLWGGGAPLTSMPPVTGWAAGSDPFFGSFANEMAPQEERPGVIVLAAEPGTEAWGEAETRWLAPAVDGLRSGRLSRLELSAGNRSFSVSARWSRRFWRRRHPWWEFYA